MSTCILVVEDNAPVGKMIQAMLTRYGYQVHWAVSGVSALATAASAFPVLVLLDMTLPDMAGTEVLNRLKTSRPALPVLVMTGLFSDPGDAFAAGGDGLLSKPFTLHQLAEAVEDFVGAPQ